MEEINVLRKLTKCLQDLEFLETFENACKENLHEEVPGLHLSKLTMYKGYVTATARMGELLKGELPRLLQEAIVKQRVLVEETRNLLQRTTS